MTEDGVEGVEILLPGWLIHIEKRITQSSFNAPFKALLYSLDKTVNADAITIDGISYPAKCLLLERVTKDDITEDDALLRFQIRYRVPVTGTFTIAGAAFAGGKQGHEYVWVMYQDHVEDETLTRRARLAGKSEVYPALPWASLGLPG